MIFRRWHTPLLELLTISLLKYWLLRMDHQVIPTLILWTGGLSVSSCLNAWLDTLPFMQVGEVLISVIVLPFSTLYSPDPTITGQHNL